MLGSNRRGEGAGSGVLGPNVCLSDEQTIFFVLYASPPVIFDLPRMQLSGLEAGLGESREKIR